ncbi:MAG: type II toxin-antitoxin system ParD family antitoxin [Pseudomonadota bacterium]|nr:type II toxin-antitoxin system ParD family antitoxin [Pseudomonadota bacterium]
MATMNVSLPDQMKEWVEDQLKDGRYGNTSDYVRHLIRKDQDRAMAIAALQAAVDEGIASGPPTPFDFDAFQARMKDRRGA